MQPILAVHLCWGAYGFWLPNDPRGSGSEYVWSDALREFGEATKVEDRSRSVARKTHDRQRRLEAKESLKYPAVQFSGIQARAIGRGFGPFARKYELAVWACAILPEHVHLVVGPHHIHAHDLAKRLKAAATADLKAEGLHPFGHLTKPNGSTPKCWQRGAWAKFLFDEPAVRREIRYVEDNPLKEGKPRQGWWFVQEYFG
jgi:REP element-mobilizing transposase RayT